MQVDLSSAQYPSSPDVIVQLKDLKYRFLVDSANI